MFRILLVSGFGVIGVLSRFCIDEFAIRFQPPLPAGTLVINVLGSFLAGLLFVAGTERGWFSPDVRTALMVGLMGGFTTFSAYSLQTVRMLESGNMTAGALYFVGSPFLGLIAAYCGIVLGRMVIA